ncbi:MAG: AraC family transcriptional regulator, partial [Planctomycetes bacterium]|nr:AraC family transcriptional regulator [Planctomycetota bacterium]
QFWIKDNQCRYIHVNTGFLHNYSLSSVDIVSGKSDFDLSPAYLAERFYEDDQKIITTGVAIYNHIELVGNNSGTVQWFNTSKTALRNKHGHIVGCSGVTYAITDQQVTSTLYGDLGPVIDTIKTHIAEHIAISDLAKIMSLSVSAFERRFKRFFKCAPSQYIKRIRIQLASEMLMTSDKSITDIALDCGFNDHSYLSREFKIFMSCSPREYRKRFIDSTSTSPSTSLNGDEQ